MKQNGNVKKQPKISYSKTALALKEGYNNSLCIGDIKFLKTPCLSTMSKNIIEKRSLNYTTTSGIKELKTAILEKELVINDYSEKNVIVSNGAKHCIFNLLMTILEEGDEVLIPKPYWPTYIETVNIFKGKIIEIETQENDFKIDMNKIEEKITDKTKVIIINSPNNPTGQILEKEEFNNLLKLAIKHNFYIISDEVYLDLYYETKSSSILKLPLSKAAKDRIFLVNSISKSYALSGLRIGYIIGPLDILKGVEALQSNMTSNPNTLAQYMTTVILKHGNARKKIIRSTLKERKNFIIKNTKNLKGIDILNIPRNGMHMLIKIDSSKKNKFIRMLEKEKITLANGENFGMENTFRISYAGENKEFYYAIKKIILFFKEVL